MLVRIKITAAPPSNIAPDEVREAWVGTEMTAMPIAKAAVYVEEEDDVGEYIVNGAAAFNALAEAGKDDAVAFWESLPYISQLRFAADCCEVVPIDGEEVRAAVAKLGEYQLHSKLWHVDGDETHRILPLMWPVIKELLLVSDACEAGMVEVKKQ